MKVRNIGTLRKLTADEGMWLTTYKDEYDIVLFDSSKSVLCPASRMSLYREITDVQNEEYTAARDNALALQGEGGE